MQSEEQNENIEIGIDKKSIFSLCHQKVDSFLGKKEIHKILYYMHKRGMC